MYGIVAYGVHIPRYRMSRKAIFEQWGWFNPVTASVARGEKAVVNYDEDTITMSVAAAINCLSDKNRASVKGLYLSSVSFPYAERQSAPIVSSALNLGQGIRSADFSNTLKSGTTALLAALDAAKSGEDILVCAADCRMGKPGSIQEHTYGDGAASLLVGSKNVIAEFKGSYTVTKDFIDFRRLPQEKYVHGWEDRWVRDEGYTKTIAEAAMGLIKKYNLVAADISKFVIACPYADVLRGLGKKWGVDAEKIQDNLMAGIGDTGTALPLMMFIAALENAKLGDTILVLGYGNGCDALYFEVTGEIEKVKPGLKGIQQSSTSKKEMKIYAKYLAFKDLIDVEVGIRGEDLPPIPMSVLWREGNTIAALVGSKCKACGTPQYPKQRICVNPECGAVDQMEEYSFSDKIGTIVSFTGDNLAFCWDPPQVYAVIDFKDGGRLLLDLTDCSLESIKIGMPVSMTFRRKMKDIRRANYTYYWKAVPVE